MRPHRHPERSGFSPLEALVCVALLALAAALAAPSMRQLIERQRLRSNAEALFADLQQARATALASGLAVRVRLDRHAGGSCILVHAGASDSCRCEDGGAAACGAAGALLKQHWLPASSGLRFEGSVRQIVFHPRYGTASSAGSFSLHQRDGASIRQVVALTGRVRSCASSGLGLPPCAS